MCSEIDRSRQSASHDLNVIMMARLTLFRGAKTTIMIIRVGVGMCGSIVLVSWHFLYG